MAANTRFTKAPLRIDSDSLEKFFACHEMILTESGLRVNPLETVLTRSVPLTSAFRDCPAMSLNFHSDRQSVRSLAAATRREKRFYLPEPDIFRRR